VDHTGRDRHAQSIKTIQTNSFAASDKIKRTTTAEKLLPPVVAVGDDVIFLDRHGKETQGKVVDLHDRAATVSCKGTYWRMAYEYLSRLDKNKIKQEQPEIADE